MKLMMEENDPCLQCGKPLGISIITEGNGRASHPHCYYRAHPFRYAEKIEDLVDGGHDPVTARRFLRAAVKHIPADVQTQYVELYNRELREFYERLTEER